jgi:hypothetical protein
VVAFLHKKKEKKRRGWDRKAYTLKRKGYNLNKYHLQLQILAFARNKQSHGLVVYCARSSSHSRGAKNIWFLPVVWDLLRKRTLNVFWHDGVVLKPGVDPHAVLSKNPIDVGSRLLRSHYKISQFYRRTNFIGMWLEVRRWFFYRHHHRRITSVGFPFVGDSPFRRYIGRKNKKTICRWFTDGICVPKKKIPAWNILTDFYSVGDIVIDRRKLSVGKSVGECMKYRPNISVL